MTKNQRKAQPIPDSLSMTMTNVSDDNTNSVKTSWNPTKSSDYTNCFDESRVTTLMEKLDNIVELDQNSIDEICKDLCKLLTDPAKEIGAYFHVKNTKKTNSTSQCTNPWFNNRCNTLRQEYFKTKNKASKHRSPENVDACKLIAKKYKQVIKKTKTEYYKKLANTLRKNKI